VGGVYHLKQISGLEVVYERVQTLQTLGLTINQAKIYLALITLKTPSAKALSKASGLAMCDVYRTINELLKLGLVETLLTSPKEFKATPPEAAAALLVNRKKKQFEEAQIKARRLLSRIRNQPALETEGELKMALVPCGDRIIQFGMPILLKDKKSLHCIQTDKLFKTFVADFFDALEALLRRNIQMRFIIESRQAIENPTPELPKLLAYSNFKVKFAFQNKIPACILVNDNASALVSTSLDPTHTPSYWSVNPCFIHVIRSYFDSMWKEAD
jgi:sugar-specific transcriptional regulator TrmB